MQNLGAKSNNAALMHRFRAADYPVKMRIIVSDLEGIGDEQVVRKFGPIWSFAIFRTQIGNCIKYRLIYLPETGLSQIIV